eukprot:COSAG01_NODE_5545_length_4192_cov_2.721231_3_plen_64_part_00
MQFFEIVCDELTTASATGELTRFGEFIDRIARSKGIKDKQLYERLSVVIEVRILWALSDQQRH